MTLSTLRLRALIEQAPSGTMKILIVDDDPAFRYLCTEILQRRNAISITVIEASSASAALEVMGATAVDCVLIDQVLPDGSGVELIGLIREAFPDYHGPMLILTAGGNEAVAAAAMRAGAADYLSKSAATSASLQRAVINAMEKANMQHSIVRRNSDLERLNAVLHQRNEEIARFYHRISHEIKTPLTAARVFMSMLHEGLAGPVTEEQRYIIDQALESCDQLTSQFNDLIECTRLETGKLTMRRQAESLPTILHRSLASVLPARDAKGIQLLQHTEEDLPLISADAGRMVQVFANILGNAVKFTPTGGQVRTDSRRCRHSPRCVEVTISDTGIGIPPEHLGHIFDRLYQVESGDDACVGAGLGLGLTIAKEIVELHGGTITVDSEVGKGTTFRLSLPVAHAQELLPEGISV